MRDLAERYAWFDQARDMDMTLAVIRGHSVGEVVSLYGGNPAEPVDMVPFQQAFVSEEDFGRYFHLQVKSRPGYVVAIEPNGWSGNVPEIARRASAGGGHFFSVYWSPSASGVLQAIDGTVTACFDPVLFDPTAEFDVNPTWASETDFATVDRLRSTCLTLLEQQTGLAVERAWFDEPLPTYRIPDPDELLKNVKDARLP
ncbi:hypothetical protein [Actinokineospora sp.]|uniref:hypothetical protein n=1 Tax=Actinokineospora sp. TaxID=1872133 RepID=UPI0040379B34